MCFGFYSPLETLEPDDPKIETSEIHGIFSTANLYVYSGYRKMPVNDFMKSAWSVFQLHNETVNIWTHLIPCLYFAYNFVYDLFFSSTLAFLDDKINFAIFDAFACCCFGFSVTYHTFRNNDCKSYRCLLRCDMFGIIVSIGASNLLYSYYPAYCPAWVRWLIVVSNFAVMTFMIVKNDWISKQSVAFLCVFYLSFSFWGLIVILIQERVGGPTEYERLQILHIYLLLGYGLFIIGIVFRVLYFPEKYFRYLFDYCGSHPISHVLVAFSISVGYWGCKELIRTGNRLVYC